MSGFIRLSTESLFRFKWRRGRGEGGGFRYNGHLGLGVLGERTLRKLHVLLESASAHVL